jgi:hypothetical protein
MATTNFKVFNEANDAANTYNDSEYQNATQRQTGVIPGMAISRMHNKMYFQWSTMVTAIAQFLTSKGYDCMDDDIQGIQDALESVVIDDATKELYAKRDTAYSVGDTGLLIGIPAGYFLECTTGGTTDTTAPVITPPVAEGATINDGSVVWTVRKCFPTSGGALTGTSLTWNGDDLGEIAVEASNIAGNGYMKFANGWIVQWGKVDCKIAESKSFTFPISFPNWFRITGSPTWAFYDTYDIKLQFSTIVSVNAGSNVHLFGTKPSANPSVTISWIAFGK